MSTLREILGNSQYWGLTLSIAAYLAPYTGNCMSGDPAV